MVRDCPDLIEIVESYDELETQIAADQIAPASAEAPADSFILAVVPQYQLKRLSQLMKFYQLVKSSQLLKFSQLMEFSQLGKLPQLMEVSLLQQTITKVKVKKVT